jgi:glucose/arabinose dehydrogenase
MNMKRLITAVVVGPVLFVASAGAQATTIAPGCDADNAGLTLPSGFCAGVFARGVPAARNMAVASNGDVFVISNSGGRGGATQRGVFRLRDANRDGKADTVQFVASGTGAGIWIAHNALYAEGGGSTILRYPFAAGSSELTGAVDTIVTGLPRGGHSTRDFVIRGNDLFVNVGSIGNVCAVGARGQPQTQPDPCTELPTRAGIWKYSATEKNQPHSPDARFAIGVRNGAGIALNPRDNEIYATQHGRDQLGPIMRKSDEYNAENPGEEFFKIVQGADYGWPYCYYSNELKKKVNAPEYGGDGIKDDRCRDKQQPIYSFPAHWAPNDAMFYSGSQFPQKYRNGVFVAFHGSWNRDPLPQAGFNVTFLPMNGDKAAGSHEVFADGFNQRLMANPPPNPMNRRPAGLVEMLDGSLLVSDDQMGTITRIVYTGR